MSEASQRGETSVEIEGGYRGEGEADAQGNKFIFPEDGYRWRKYGQKFIKGVGKNRSYFKCQRSNCFARKKVEWSILEPEYVQVLYEGVHNHVSPTIESISSQTQTSSSSANQYDLWIQVFGDRSISRHDNEQVFGEQSTSHHKNKN